MELTNQPLVSVLMPVYNAEAYIAASLQSLLEQEYSRLEIMLVDDASTDQSVDIVQSFNDPRIRIVKNTENIGLAASLNKAIGLSTGFFLARMDADDIAHPERISRQVQFMLNHPEVDVLGTSMQYFGASKFLNHFPITHEACKSYLLLNVCFGHPTVMFRRTVFDSPENLYNPAYRQYSEEYDLWCRLADRFRFHNLNDVLLYYRTYPPLIKSEAEQKRMMNSAVIRKKFLSAHLGEVSAADWDTHCTAVFLRKVSTKEEIQKIDRWFQMLLARNAQVKAFNQEILRTQLAERFFEACYANARLRMFTMALFYTSAWSKSFKPGLKRTTKFILKQVAKIS